MRDCLASRQWQWLVLAPSEVGFQSWWQSSTCFCRILRTQFWDAFCTKPILRRTGCLFYRSWKRRLTHTHSAFSPPLLIPLSTIPIQVLLNAPRPIGRLILFDSSSSSPLPYYEFKAPRSSPPQFHRPKQSVVSSSPADPQYYVHRCGALLWRRRNCQTKGRLVSAWKKEISPISLIEEIERNYIGIFSLGQMQIAFFFCTFKVWQLSVLPLYPSYQSYCCYSNAIPFSTGKCLGRGGEGPAMLSSSKQERHDSVQFQAQRGTRQGLGLLLLPLPPPSGKHSEEEAPLPHS